MQTFTEYFQQFGKIEDSVIMIDKETGKSRGITHLYSLKRWFWKGFGFVTFDVEESVEKVIDRYNDNTIDGKWVN